jgi:putative Ca2+/H+ antiporter (TMEM165/GDT1 family)
VSSFLDAKWFRYLIGFSFIAMAGWVLIPDKESDAGESKSHRGIFLTTLIAFFIVEMGDKTQIATAALAARFANVWIVAAGTTTGMMLANIPAALFGQAITRVVPLWLMRLVSAAIYAVLGVISVAETAGYLG